MKKLFLLALICILPALLCIINVDITPSNILVDLNNIVDFKFAKSNEGLPVLQLIKKNDNKGWEIKFIDLFTIQDPNNLAPASQANVISFKDFEWGASNLNYNQDKTVASFNLYGKHKQAGQQQGGQQAQVGEDNYDIKYLIQFDINKNELQVTKDMKNIYNWENANHLVAHLEAAPITKQGENVQYGAEPSFNLDWISQFQVVNDVKVDNQNTQDWNFKSAMANGKIAMFIIYPKFNNLLSHTFKIKNMEIQNLLSQQAGQQGQQLGQQQQPSQQMPSQQQPSQQIPSQQLPSQQMPSQQVQPQQMQPQQQVQRQMPQQQVQRQQALPQQQATPPLQSGFQQYYGGYDNDNDNDYDDFDDNDDAPLQSGFQQYNGNDDYDYHQYNGNGDYDYHDYDDNGDATPLQSGFQQYNGNDYDYDYHQYNGNDDYDYHQYNGNGDYDGY